MDEQPPTTPKPDEQPAQFQPGTTITPGQTSPPPTADDTPSPAPEAAAQPPVESPAQPTPLSASVPASNVSEQPSYTLSNEPDEPTPTTYWQGDPADSVSWTASEFIAHHKSAGWYVLLNGGVIALAVLVWLATRDMVAAGVIVFAGIVLSAYGARKPRQLQYHLDDHGLTIQERHYGYQEFRSFSVFEDGPFASIGLMPLKRFSPLLTLYCDPQDEDRIIDLLSRYLPHEVRKPDAIDMLMRRIRF